MANIESLEEKLKMVCSNYGVNSEYALFRDNIIIVPDDGNDIYLVFDKNCNILGVERYIKNCNVSFIDYFEDKYDYTKENDDEICPDLMSNAFDTYFISMTKEMAGKSYFSNYDNDNATHCFFKGKLIDDNHLIELISCFEFLNYEINNYSKISLGMQRMGYDMPDITSYINSVLDKLDSYIDNCISQNRKPVADEFITILGQGNLSVNKVVLRNIFNYLLREKGYVSDSTLDRLIDISEDNKIDTSELSMKLIKMMD